MTTFRFKEKMAYTASVKNLHVNQELKNNGIEIGVWEDDKQFGDIYVAKTGVIWCDGKKHRDNGTKFTFKELSLISQYKDEALKAAKKAKKAKKDAG